MVGERMSNTYKHKKKGKVKRNLVEWNDVFGKGKGLCSRSCTCERCENGRKFFDAKHRKAAEYDMKHLTD